MRRFVSLRLLSSLLVCYHFPHISGHGGCQIPTVNPAAFVNLNQHYGGCRLLKRVCADDGMLVTFDPEYTADNLTRANPLGHLESQSALWNFPSRGGSNSDALVGHQPNSYVAIRPASRKEAAPHLREPIFSPCTLPVIMMTDWPYNFHEVIAQLACIADVYFRQNHAIDDLVTLVLATPLGLALTPFHQVLLSPYSRYPVIDLDQLSQRPVHEQHVTWSAEGFHVSCFEQAVLCKMHGFPQPALPTATVVYDHIKAHVPPDPLGFNPPGQPPVPLAEEHTLRVVLEARTGGSRNIKNLADIKKACEEANSKGFSAGTFSRLSCKVLSTADTPKLHGVPRFYANVGAVRSAHVLVAMHGAGAANCMFMEAKDGITALLEVRPCQFGTTYCGWPDAYMQSQLDRSERVIRFFALNVEDPAQCQPSDFAAVVHNDDIRARDQHVTINPRTMISMIRHIGTLLRNKTAYDAANMAFRLHGYAMAQGLVLGPLCVRDMDAHFRNGATVITE